MHSEKSVLRAAVYLSERCLVFQLKFDEGRIAW